MKKLDNWPRVIQLAWAFYDSDFKLVNKQVDLIKPDGWTIPKEKFWIENGFDQAISEKEGIPITGALEDFRDRLESSKYLVAHNMSYDYNVVGAEFLRIGLKSKNRPTRICTKDTTTDFCKIPGQYGSYKWPRLDELYSKLFNETFDDAHDALADVEACARCFFELLRQKVIQP
ncbi:3'-5' exonuclease [Puniceicoccaceae bacterium K14]|nr:3'-5' exonuclease [Puniceicoccaceae bacterium K14]